MVKANSISAITIAALVLLLPLAKFLKRGGEHIMQPAHSDGSLGQRPELEAGVKSSGMDPSSILGTYAGAEVGRGDRFAFRIWIACWLILWMVGLLNWLAT